MISLACFERLQGDGNGGVSQFHLGVMNWEIASDDYHDDYDDDDMMVPLVGSAHEPTVAQVDGRKHVRP